MRQTDEQFIAMVRRLVPEHWVHAHSSLTMGMIQFSCGKKIVNIALDPHYELFKRPRVAFNALSPKQVASVLRETS